MIPRPGEFGHNTWENDAWQWTGDVSSWAPMAADPERGLVYIPTNGATMDFYGGFRPGDNLFGTSLIALDVKTGQARVALPDGQARHLELRHARRRPSCSTSTSTAGAIPGVFQATKQAYLYSFNRQTGEPIWPIVERPAPQSKVPGEKLAATQPHPTKPAPYDLQGRTEEHLIDYTPEIKRLALEAAKATNQLAPLFNPPTHRGNAEGAGPGRICPGDTGGVNITGPPAADPAAGIIFITSHSGCGAVHARPGERTRQRPDDRHDRRAVGTRIRGAAGAAGRGGAAEGRGAAPAGRGPAGRSRRRGFGPGSPLAGIPGLFKGPVGRITAIDVNTGEHLWMIPHGDMSQEQQDAFRNNPLLKGVNVDTNWGRSGHAAMMATSTLLFATGSSADSKPMLFGIDKKTGKRVGAVATPEMGGYGLMTYMHQGKQYVMLPVQGGYTALALP